MNNIVAIVGRPNVGKSTLFNRLTESRKAIVDSESGVTRDRHYGKCEWNGREFTVVDTGGYVKGSDDVFEGEIRSQVEIAIEEAQAILFVVDAANGILDLDETVAKLLRRSKKDVFLVVNKVDNSDRLLAATEFYSLGFDNFYTISAVSGSGTGELLDELLKVLPEKEPEVDLDIPKIAIVGRPNVGKSSLLNALLGVDRNIVTPLAGTTRDTIYTRFNSFGFDFFLIDTAGLRKKSKVHEDLEFYSVMRSIRAIEECDIALLMLDAKDGLESQDLNIFSLIQKNHKGVVILVNKWDLIEKDNHSTDDFKNRILEKIVPFKDVPILFISVTNKQRVIKALEEAIEVFNNRKKKIPTRKLNDLLLPIIQAYPPPANKGKYIHIKFITQLPTHFPSFAFFCNLPQYIKEPYKRFLENKLREIFDFKGVPVEIFFRKK